MAENQYFTEWFTLGIVLCVWCVLSYSSLLYSVRWASIFLLTGNSFTSGFCKSSLCLCYVSDVCVCVSIKQKGTLLARSQKYLPVKGWPDLIMFPLHAGNCGIQLCTWLTAWVPGQGASGYNPNPRPLTTLRASLRIVSAGRKGYLFLVYSSMFAVTLLMQITYNRWATLERNFETLGNILFILASWGVGFFISPFSIMHLGTVP